MANTEATTSANSTDHYEALFQQLESYKWDSDPEFQSGLQAILGPNPTPDQAEQLTIRARCFYFLRKNNVPIDFNAYQTWRSQRPLHNGTSSNASAPSSMPSNTGTTAPTSATRYEPSAGANRAEPPVPYPTSFSQIVELITTGQPIPGIKDIPDTVLEGQASQATTAKRKKPWEKDDTHGGSEEILAMHT